MTLVDSSIWVNHFRYGSPRLESLLRDTQVLIHPFIVGELDCGGLKNREEVLALLCALPETHIPEHHEVMHLLEAQKLYGTGIGWVAMNLLAAAQLTGCALWTADTSLQKAAAKLQRSE